MAHSTDIVGYTYQADNYCPEHIVKAVIAPLEGHGLSYVTEDALSLVARFRGIDRMDERTFDSGDFPKVIFRDQCEGWDRCAVCGAELDD